MRLCAGSNWNVFYAQSSLLFHIMRYSLPVFHECLFHEKEAIGHSRRQNIQYEKEPYFNKVT